MEYQKAKQQVDERNAIRQLAGLPLLDDNEITKTINASEEQAYEKFYLANCDKALAIVLEQHKKVDPDYKIDSFGKSVSIGAAIRKLVKEWWKDEQNAARI